MYKLSYEDLLKKYNALLSANIAMAKSLSEYSQKVNGLNYKIEILEDKNRILNESIVSITESHLHDNEDDYVDANLAALYIFNRAVDKIENNEDIQDEIKYLEPLDKDLQDSLIEKQNESDEYLLSKVGKNPRLLKLISESEDKS